MTGPGEAPDDPAGDVVAAADASSPPREHGFRWYAIAVFLIGLSCSVAISAWLPFEATGTTVWTAIALFVAFLVAEQLAINVDVRSGVSWTISFTEIPLVIGLIVADFEVVLVAHLVAGVGTLAVRKVSGKLIYNTGVLAIEICAAFAVAELIKRLVAAETMPWYAAFLGAVSAPLASTLLALVTVWVLKQRMQLGTGLRFVRRVVVVGIVNASAGASGYLLVTSVQFGWLVVGTGGIGLILLYLAYSGLLREQRDLEALSDVSLMVAESARRAAARPASDDPQPQDANEEWVAIAARIKDQLSARRVVLRLHIDGSGTLRTFVVGTPLPPGEQHEPDDPVLTMHGSKARLFRITDIGHEVRALMSSRGAEEEVLAAPLRSASHFLGVVEAHDRDSRWRGFTKSDVQLIETMAAHLATALDNRRLMATLRHDAYHDPLTGLLNRPGFCQAARGVLAPDHGAVVLRVDLDVVSTVGDALGYTWADRMVVAAGRRLRDVLGSAVPVARLEGASFAALMSAKDATDAHAIAGRVRAELSQPYPVDRLSVEASAVVGYASGESEDVRLDIDGLLQRADVAVRATSGDEPVRGYAPSMGQIFLRRFQLVTQFRYALENDQVSVHYQPKVSLESKAVRGVEALVRWRHPEFGPINPEEFVPAIEAAGLIDVLTSFVLDSALARVRKWLDAGIRISVAVNLSVRSLADTDFAGKVADALARFDVPADLLTFELTESGVMADPQRALPVLRELHALGVVLAVDDFGTGYSSLAYLRQLPVDEVKIDKSFVLGMGTDLGDLAVVRSIVELGHSLGLTVVAEGVEEDVARDQLEAMGCDVVQGYLISRPLSEKRLEAWLQARTARAIGRHAETVLTLLT